MTKFSHHKFYEQLDWNVAINSFDALDWVGELESYKCGFIAPPLNKMCKFKCDLFKLTKENQRLNTTFQNKEWMEKEMSLG